MFGSLHVLLLDYIGAQTQARLAAGDNNLIQIFVGFINHGSYAGIPQGEPRLEGDDYKHRGNIQ